MLNETTSVHSIFEIVLPEWPSIIEFGRIVEAEIRTEIVNELATVVQ